MASTLGADLGTIQHVCTPGANRDPRIAWPEKDYEKVVQFPARSGITLVVNGPQHAIRP